MSLKVCQFLPGLLPESWGAAGWVALELKRRVANLSPYAFATVRYRNWGPDMVAGRGHEWTCQTARTTAEISDIPWMIRLFRRSVLPRIFS